MTEALLVPAGGGLSHRPRRGPGRRDSEADVSERSVAEIIGWSDGHRMTPSGVCAFCGAPQDDAIRSWCPHGISSPTVDDLLAWLMGDRQLIPVIKSYVGGWSLAFADDNLRTVYQSPSPSGHRTLLAALEAAVRAVAGES